MDWMRRRVVAFVFAVLTVGASAFAQSNRIDIVTPSAPELAGYGTYAIGVRTLQVTDKNRPDILNTKEGGPTARYDRTLTLEVWYPRRSPRARNRAATTARSRATRRSP